MVKVTSPSPEYDHTDTYGDGTVLAFVKGVAEIAELPAPIRSYLTGAGYAVRDDAPAEPEGKEAAATPVDEAEPDDLEDRTVADLRDYAVEYGIDLEGLTRKADIVAAIRAHFAALPDRTAD